MSKFEKKFGKYAIHNLTMVLIMCYVAGYVIELMGSAAGNNLLGFLTLDPYRILHGQIWRLVTWVIVPPDSLDIFTIIMLLFYYNLGTAGADLGNLPLQRLYFFRYAVHDCRQLPVHGSSLPAHRRYGNGDRIRGILQRVLCVQHLLYQLVHLSGVCRNVSGYAGTVDVRDPCEGKMDGNSGCHSDGLYGNCWKSVHQVCGSGITFEFCVILLQTASQPYLAETDAPQGAVRTKIQCWTGESHKTQMCRLRTDRRGRSESGVPFLLQM